MSVLEASSFLSLLTEKVSTFLSVASEARFSEIVTSESSVLLFGSSDFLSGTIASSAFVSLGLVEALAASSAFVSLGSVEALAAFV